MTPHPAPFNPQFLAQAKPWLDKGWAILDPFAGIGRVHDLQMNTVGLELEPEWANQRKGTVVGDATHMPFGDQAFDAIVTSPSFGNRLSDHHNARDSSKRITYKHMLGRDLHVNNSGAMAWGNKYRDLHVAAYEECDRVLKPGGRFILNMKNFYETRKGKRIEHPVTEFHIGELLSHGWFLRALEPVKARGMRFGANRSQRADHEWLAVFDKPA